MNAINKYDFSEVDNLLMNMSAGLLPEHLAEDEVKLLEERYDMNWFTDLGYSEPKYRKPSYSSN